MKIKALGYVVLESNNLMQWDSFLKDVVGLMPAPAFKSDALNAADDLKELYFKIDEYSWRIKVVSGDTDRLAIAGWELDDKFAFDQAILELSKASIEIQHLSAEACDQRKVREAISLLDPAGNVIELFYAMKLDYGKLISSAGIRGFETGYHGDMGLGHFVIPTDRFEECFHFYTKILGFSETDYMHFKFNPDPADPGQGLHFLHVDNPRHHSLALYQDPNPSPTNCVHLMLEVKDVDEVGYFIDRCKNNGVPIVSSLGRHTNDLMMSVYVATPGGFALEFGCDGVQLDWTDYKPTESSVPSLWGHEWTAPE